MQPTYTVEAEAYREKVQAFLAEHLPPGWHGLGSLEGDALTEFTLEWRRTLYENGMLALGWPREYGGAGLTSLEQVIVAEEFAKAGVPAGATNDVFGIQMVGNTILQWGSEEQKKHYLPRILSRRGHLVSGLLRAERRIRPREPRLPRGPRRRRVRHQRPEDLDVGRASRRSHLLAHAHRSRGVEAQGHLVHARRHASAWCRGAPDPDDVGGVGVQRGVLHRRAVSEGERARRGEQRMGRRDDAARLRARRSGGNGSDPVPQSSSTVSSRWHTNAA